MTPGTSDVAIWIGQNTLSSPSFSGMTIPGVSTPSRRSLGASVVLEQRSPESVIADATMQSSSVSAVGSRSPHVSEIGERTGSREEKQEALSYQLSLGLSYVLHRYEYGKKYEA